MARACPAIRVISHARSLGFGSYFVSFVAVECAIQIFVVWKVIFGRNFYVLELFS